MAGILTHHGVKGMKWGVRKRRESKKARKSKNTSSRSKKILKTTAIVAGVGVAAVGAAFLAKKLSQNRMTQPVNGLKALESTEKLVENLLVKASERPAFSVNASGTATKLNNSSSTYSDLKKQVDGMDTRSAVNFLRNMSNPATRVGVARERGELFTRLFNDKTITSGEASRRMSEVNKLINKSLTEYVR